MVVLRQALPLGEVGQQFHRGRRWPRHNQGHGHIVVEALPVVVSDRRAGMVKSTPLPLSVTLAREATATGKRSSAMAIAMSIPPPTMGARLSG